MPAFLLDFPVYMLGHDSTARRYVHVGFQGGTLNAVCLFTDADLASDFRRAKFPQASVIARDRSELQAYLAERSARVTHAVVDPSFPMRKQTGVVDIRGLEEAVNL